MSLPLLLLRESATLPVLPMFHMLRTILFLVVAVLALVIICTKNKSMYINELKGALNEVVGYQRTLLKLLGLVIGLSGLVPVLSGLFGFSELTNFAPSCILVAMFSVVGVLMILRDGARAYKQRQEQAGSTGVPFMKIDSFNYYGNFASADNGSSINQTAQGNSVMLHQLMDAVSKSGNELTAPQKSAALEELKVLADQSMKPAAQREHFKIQDALKRLPGFLSSAASLAEAWSKLEPWITSIGKP